MTEQKYKVGDRVLVEATAVKIDDDGTIKICLDDDHWWIDINAVYSHAPLDIDGNVLRPGDECKFWDDEDNIQTSKLRSITIPINTIVKPFCSSKTDAWYFNCRKITKPKTITIDGVVYDKSEVDEMLKKLKPLEGE